MIRAYDLPPDGTVHNMRVFHDFYPGRSADGLCIDTSATFTPPRASTAAAAPAKPWTPKPGIHVFSPGESDRFMPVPEDTVTNCAFGGADMRTLYVTAGKTLFQVPRKAPACAARDHSLTVVALLRRSCQRWKPRP